MGLFKSKQERKLERDMEIRKGINACKRSIRELLRHEQEYIKKARRARQLGAEDQVRFLKRTIRQTAAQRRALERQLLAIETAAQRKNQMEMQGQFARSLAMISKSIAEVFGDINWAEVQANFEKAMLQAETFEQQAELFLEASQETMFTEKAFDEEEVSEAEIDRLIEEEAAHEEQRALDREIESGLGEIERELRERE
ncbi:MAG: hypothetical protein KatS3mg102_0232 [Planctomycetota bacterium]|nr:MAG: hypothetical protein KatS3mg102_0232 [Planctomycetota bacterium]